MGRPPPDPDKVARAWELVIKEGLSFPVTARQLAKEFDCDVVQPATIMRWVRQGRQAVGYVRLLNVEENRKRVAERFRDLYGQAWAAYSRGGMTSDERSAMDVMLKIQHAEVKLFGMDAAMQVHVQSAPPEVKESIVAAIARTMAEEDSPTV